MPHVRHNLGSKISEVEEEIITELRGKVGLSIDDRTEVMRRWIREEISGWERYRASKRGVVALRQKEASEATA
ncbi:MAG TPA: hypothetical protein LFW21_07705, partial [Rickettsia endosymbiont of Pyrocoelia pectoralis]|nr:hypothetical protein [Rickettsia endosymbiont of Pyrocoelia pectoralis]